MITLSDKVIPRGEHAGVAVDTICIRIQRLPNLYHFHKFIALIQVMGVNSEMVVSCFRDVFWRKRPILILTVLYIRFPRKQIGAWSTHIKSLKPRLWLKQF